MELATAMAWESDSELGLGYLREQESALGKVRRTDQGMEKGLGLLKGLQKAKVSERS